MGAEWNDRSLSTPERALRVVVLAAFTVLLFVLIALAIGFEIKRSASITEVALVALTLCYVVVSAAQ